MSDAAKVPSVPATMLKRQQNIERVKTARQVAVVKRKKELKTKRTVLLKTSCLYALHIFFGIPGVLSVDSSTNRNLGDKREKGKCLSFVNESI